MASNDSDTVLDFKLVWTYIPGLMLMLRGLALLILYFCLVFTLPKTRSSPTHDSIRSDVVIFVLSTVVYFDGWSFRHDALSKASGHLGPILLAIVTTGSHLFPEMPVCPDMASVIVYYISSVAWAASSSFCVVNMLLRLQSFDVHLASVPWAILGLVLLFTDCHKRTSYELVCRVLIFYALCIFLWFSQTLQPDLERQRFAFTVLHASIHILFVDLYVAFGSVAVWILIFIYYYHTNVKPKSNPITTPTITKRVQTSTDTEKNLLRELEAAKRAGGMV